MSILNNIIEFFTDFIMSDNFLSIVDKKGVLERRIRANTLFLTTDRDIIDIEKENYGEITHQTKRDFIQYNYYMFRDILNISIEDIKTRFTDDFEGVINRMKFRIELYRDGWDIEQIESYIYKYILKSERPLIDEAIYTNYYTNLMLYLNVIKKNKKRDKGRPKLPVSLREYIREKHLSRVRNNMRMGYKKQELFDEINSRLLTHDEIERLKGMFEDKNDNLLLKLKDLYIREI